LHDAFNNCFGVFETCENFFCATVFFDEREFEGTIVAFFVNVRDSAHNWAHNYFGVIVEKVDLNWDKKTHTFLISVHLEINIFGLKIDTWIVPLDKCKIIAFLVLNHVRKNGRRDISSPGLGAILAPAFNFFKISTNVNSSLLYRMKNLTQIPEKFTFNRC